MIIESHAHYSHKLYNGEFPYVCYKDGSFDVSVGDFSLFIEELKQNNISFCIEPSTSFENIDAQLALVRKYPDYIKLSLGVHPGKCTDTAWKNRKKLSEYVRENDVIAIGEAGLDYHNELSVYSIFLQKMWFKYQIRLADEYNLPLILHIRMADEDGLKILTRYRKKLHGGVAHCFVGDFDTAMKYIELGFYLGIGGKLFINEVLQDTVKRVPLESILVETDAPYIIPEIQTCSLSNKKKKKARNSSLILQAVIDKIALLRDDHPEHVEKVVYENTLRVFSSK